MGGGNLDTFWLVLLLSSLEKSYLSLCSLSSRILVLALNRGKTGRRAQAHSADLADLGSDSFETLC